MSMYEFITSRDYHIHTHLSVCAREEMTTENIIRRAEKIGYAELGISDHLGGYLKPAEAGKTREFINAVQTDLTVYLGCEIGVLEDGTPLTESSDIDFFDYVMIGVDHVDGPQQEDVEPLRWLDGYVARLEALLAWPGRIDVIVHPLRTLRRHHEDKPLMAHVPRARWEELLGKIAERNIAIELSDACENWETCFDALREYYALAHRLGIKFSLASDAHGLDRLGFQINWVPIVLDMGLSEDDFWSPVAP